VRQCELTLNLNVDIIISGIRDSMVCIGTMPWAGQPRIGVRVPAVARVFYGVWTGSGPHSASIPMGTGLFPLR
jgi:hypothetical protein